MTVLELRQYRMVPGRRDDFVDIFDREFVESQEALGVEVLGQFRDLGNPNRYVWIRRFPDMESRKASLEAFYDGPVWAEHKDAANATMTEWHDVLLLRPVWEGGDLNHDANSRAAPGAGASTGGEMTIVVWPFDLPKMAAFIEAFRTACPDALAAYVTDPSENTYPGLPIREGENVFVGVFSGAIDVRVSALADLASGPETALALAPTPRSALRGG